MTDYKELKYVLEIARQAGISKAARSLHVTQPALSRFLGALEEDLGTRLFDRVGKKMIPTYAGRRYLESAQKILLIHEQFLAEVSDIKMDRKGMLTIGSTPGRGKKVFPYIVPELHNKYPDFKIQIYHEVVKDLERDILNGNIQIGLFTTTEGEAYKGLTLSEIATEEIVLVLPKNKKVESFPKAGFKYPWVDIMTLKDEELLLLNEGSRLREVENQIMKNWKLGQKTMEFNSIDTIWQMISNGFGFSFASDFKAEEFTETSLYSFGPRPIQWHFVAATRIGMYITEPVQYVMNIIQKEFGEDRHDGSEFK